MASLQEVYELNSSYDLVSVIGGLAFLHAVGPRAQSLSVFDVDADAIPYAKMILTLIQKCTSLKEFISYLTRRDVPSDWMLHKRLDTKIDPSEAVAKLLNNQELFELYQSTFGSIAYDASTGIGKIDESTIHFFDFSLTPMHFYWQFGQGIFEDDESFLALQKTLNAISIKVENKSLDLIDYSELSTNSKNELILLASNCDSPLFTKNDSIVRRLQSTTLTCSKYYSWLRKLTIYPRQNMKLLSETLTLHIGAAFVHSIGMPFLNLSEIINDNRYNEIDSFEKLSQNLIYNAECLLVWNLSDESTIKRLVPLFHKIIIISQVSLNLDLLYESIKSSYAISLAKDCSVADCIVLTLNGSILLEA